MSIDRTKYMDAEEVNRLRAAAIEWAERSNRRHSLRGGLVWALVDVALGTGLRVSEIAALIVADVDLRRGALRVGRRKRRKVLIETIPISEDLRDHLAEFIGQAEPRRHLFMGKRGPMTDSGLQKVWKAAIRRAGLPKELSIHRARHTLAVHLLRASGNLRMVQKQLGHASPVITANMYADVSFEDMRAGLNKAYGAAKENGPE